VSIATAGNGYVSASSRRQHFGLGDGKKVDEVEISWPSGQRTVIHDLEVNRLHQITEGIELTVDAR